MEFSLFNLMTIPERGVTHEAIFSHMRQMTTLVDEAGFDVAWFAEHHLSSYCVSPSPLMLCAHMAAQTKRIKLGPAVVVMPFYEPLRLVEDICLTDQLCEGRFVLGLGTGYQPREFTKFGFALDDRMQRGLEVWDVIDQALSSGRVDYRGRHVSIDDAALSIAPRQASIRTFAVGNAPEFRQRIAQRGAVPMCTPAVGPTESIGTVRRLIEETRGELGMTPRAPELAVQRYVFVTDDAAERRQVAEQVLAQARMATNMRQAEPSMDGVMLELVPYENEPSLDEILDRAIIGSAEQVSEQIVDEAREYGITHLSVFMQIAAIPYPAALQSLERFCAHVMPAVKRELGTAAAA